MSTPVDPWERQLGPSHLEAPAQVVWPLQRITHFTGRVGRARLIFIDIGWRWAGPWPAGHLVSLA